MAGTGPDAASIAPGPVASGPEAGAPPVLPPPRTTPDAFGGAPPFVSKVGSSPHNPGQSCMKSGCHGPGGGETPFLIGGTVYKDYKGTIPAPGVEIRVLDAKGNAMSVYSGSNGNFYIHTSATLTPPFIVGARDGTTTRPMVTTITGTMGTCAASGCHVVGGSPMTAAYYPIHVP
ncbi:MAG: hypothetical protein M3O36_19180 [Myxococcota bacterium]|nr:hypothetical protein [Myxococcota bacterium]